MQIRCSGGKCERWRHPMAFLLVAGYAAIVMFGVALQRLLRLRAEKVGANPRVDRAKSELFPVAVLHPIWTQPVDLGHGALKEMQQWTAYDVFQGPLGLLGLAFSSRSPHGINPLWPPAARQPLSEG